MTFWERLIALLQRKPVSAIVKEKLTDRQLQVAERLAEMKGVTRDEILAEAYRRADRIIKPR